MQGSMLEHIRSNKYKGIQCYGIVITARCDLEQGKVEIVHCLAALCLDDWIEHVLSSNLLNAYEKETIFTPLRKIAETAKMDYASLIEFSSDDIKKVCEKNCTKKDYQNVEKILTDRKQLEQIRYEYTSNKKVGFLVKKYKKRFQHELLDLYGGKNYKYCFLPKKSYATEATLLDGLVVDLQNIISIELADCESILQNKYDYLSIQDKEEKERINNTFFFEPPDDFVIFGECIKSPWIEYLMQKFAFSFTRIGVQTPLKDEAESYIEDLMEGYQSV